MTRGDVCKIATLALVDNALAEIQTIRILANHAPLSVIASERIDEALEAITDALLMQRQLILVPPTRAKAAA
jgi:hypothetical protein